MAKTSFVIVKNTLTDRTKKFFTVTNPGGEIDIKAKTIMGLQLLNNIINGSPRNSLVPPIMTGRLRASGSVFVGSEFSGDTSNQPVQEGVATPNKSYSDKKEIVTVGFNTEYAARWHEQDFTPGGKIPSKIAQSNPAALANVGKKYIEKHLQSDGPELTKLYATIVRRETSKI